MGKKKTDAEKLVTVQAAAPVVILRANRPLNEQQHEELSRKIRDEMQHTGVEVLLVPYSVEVEIATDLKPEDNQQSDPQDDSKTDDSDPNGNPSVDE